MTTPSEIFHEILRHVLGQTLNAAQYELEDLPMHHARGLFRYRKQLAENRFIFIEFQTLYHPQSELSRLRINLIRNSTVDSGQASPERVEQTLPAIIWHEYGVQILPSDDHWWMYKHQQDLAYTLLDAGKLLFGYGVPWIEGQDTSTP